MNNEIHILVVDDNRENLKIVSSLLAIKGFKIALALDGKSALKIIGDHKIDLVLLDVNMPEMNGFEVCEAIKENRETASIPIIFLTASTDNEDVIHSFAVGGSDYLSKPFKKEELYTRVYSNLKLKLIRETIGGASNEDEDNINYVNKLIERIQQIIDLDKL